MTAGDLPGKERLADVAVGKIPAGQGREVVCFVRGHRTAGDRVIRIKVRYQEPSGGEECAVERDEKLSFAKAFQVGAHVSRQQVISSVQAQHLSEVNYAQLEREELFSLAVSVKPACEASVVITDVTLFPVVNTPCWDFIPATWLTRPPPPPPLFLPCRLQDRAARVQVTPLSSLVPQSS